MRQEARAARLASGDGRPNQPSSNYYERIGFCNYYERIGFSSNYYERIGVSKIERIGVSKIRMLLKVAEKMEEECDKKQEPRALLPETGGQPKMKLVSLESRKAPPHPFLFFTLKPRVE